MGFLLLPLSLTTGALEVNSRDLAPGIPISRVPRGRGPGSPGTQEALLSLLSPAARAAAARARPTDR